MFLVSKRDPSVQSDVAVTRKSRTWRVLAMGTHLYLTKIYLFTILHSLTLPDNLVLLAESVFLSAHAHASVTIMFSFVPNFLLASYIIHTKGANRSSSFRNSSCVCQHR